jgi:hypothetical protein
MKASINHKPPPPQKKPAQWCWRSLSLILICLIISPHKRSEAGRGRITVNCPADGTVHVALTTVSRNRSGGLDSDGCAYSIEQKQLVVHGNLNVITCPCCFYSVRKRDLKRSLSAAEKRKVLSAIKHSGLAPKKQFTHSEAIPSPTRHLLSIVCYQAIGGARAWRSSLAAPELYARLLLQGAWIERGQAVTQGGQSEFRPQNTRSGHNEFVALKLKIRDRKYPSIEEIRRLEKVLTQLGQLQNRVGSAFPSKDAVQRFQKQELDALFLELESDLRNLKAIAKARADKAAAALMSNESRTLKLRLAQAALRLGLRKERELVLQELTKEALPKPLSLAVKAMQAHISVEEQLLRKAITQLESLSMKSHPRALELQFLLGDLWRRLGDPKKARAYFISIQNSTDPWYQQESQFMQSLLED